MSCDSRISRVDVVDATGAALKTMQSARRRVSRAAPMSISCSPRSGATSDHPRSGVRQAFAALAGSRHKNAGVTQHWLGVPIWGRIVHHRFDHLAKNILRDALSRACTAETEVEVLAATQKIDVFTIPDPARAAERARMGLLGELAAQPCLFEPFHDTPTLRQLRRCLNKQHTWHHELERRARSAAGAAAAEPGRDKPAAGEMPFPVLVVIGPGIPETVLDAYGCKSVSPGVYHAVWGLALRIVAISELPRTRETLLLRLLGKGRLFKQALADLADLPGDAWEQSVATPLLVHFQLGSHEHPTTEEDNVSAEIRAWFEDYQRKLRSEGRKKGRKEGRREGRKEGERRLLLRQLRSRFGELPAAAVARIEAADIADIERWGERILGARTLAEVLEGQP